MTALVTGAAGGIGSAIAAALSNTGQRVIRHDLRAEGPEGRMDICGDLTDQAVLDTIAERVRTDGIRTVVAAHGVAGAEALSTIKPATAEFIMRANTISVLRLYEAIKDGLGTKGAYVVVASQAGLVGEANNGVYCASKFALLGWARAVSRIEAGPRLRLLCPGATETPLLRSAFQGMADSAGLPYQDILNGRLQHIPVGRLGQTTNLGAAVAWLAELATPRLLVAPVTGGEVLW